MTHVPGTANQPQLAEKPPFYEAKTIDYIKH